MDTSNTTPIDQTSSGDLPSVNNPSAYQTVLDRPPSSAILTITYERFCNLTPLEREAALINNNVLVTGRPSRPSRLFEWSWDVPTQNVDPVLDEQGTCVPFTCAACRLTFEQSCLSEITMRMMKIIPCFPFPASAKELVWTYPTGGLKREKIFSRGVVTFLHHNIVLTRALDSWVRIQRMKNVLVGFTLLRLVSFPTATRVVMALYLCFYPSVESRQCKLAPHDQNSREARVTGTYRLRSG